MINLLQGVCGKKKKNKKLTKEFEINFFKKKSDVAMLSAHMCTCVCVCVGTCVCVFVCVVPIEVRGKGRWGTGAGVTGKYELAYVGAVNWTWVMCL